ncbi:MAG: hypothetical protein MJE66_20175, partial [Proteobacteria bacterium]|nr:hypothetical protein [Pseudomonadota bacterium]
MRRPTLSRVLLPLLALCASCGDPEPGPPTQGLVLALAQFETRVGEDGRRGPVPLAARLEFLVPGAEGWSLRSLEDADSNVFHKAMPLGGELLTIGGTEAVVKLWRPGASGLEARELWRKDFGGRFSRMRDVEVADLYGDGQTALAVATHDQGVVAVLRPEAEGGYRVEELDAKVDTFVHEIEVGDVNADGVLEVYATPSDPNRFDGSVQHGQVVRYVPAAGGAGQVVADL